MPSMRSSVARITRDTSDDPMMARMNHEAILMPSGRSKMLSTVVYTNTSMMGANSLRCFGSAIVTATAAELMSISTPVA